MIYKQNLLDGIIDFLEDQSRKLLDCYQDLEGSKDSLMELYGLLELVDQHTRAYSKELRALSRCLRRGPDYIKPRLRSVKEEFIFYKNSLNLLKDQLLEEARQSRENLKILSFMEGLVDGLLLGQSLLELYIGLLN